MSRRAGVQARIDAASGRGERVVIRNTELRAVDGQINRLKADLAGFQAELRQREALAEVPPEQPVLPPAATPNVALETAPTVPTAPTAMTVPAAAGTSAPPRAGLDLNAMAIGGLATVLVLVPLLFALALRSARRAALPRRPEREEAEARLTRMEDAITAIGMDVERLSESQRSLTSALVADGMQTPAREAVHTRG
jgi:hypothetical protein